MGRSLGNSGHGGVYGAAAVLESLFLLSLASTLLVSGQSGFISIDCGKPKDYTYTDAITGLPFTSDFQYIDTGELHQIASNFKLPGQISQVTDLRSFPNGTRNCFNITPVKKGSNYLIRVVHFYGNYDGRNQLPQFDVYVGVHFWYAATIFHASIMYYQEIVIPAASDAVSVCLVNTGSGTPFISALELRPLPDGIYPQVNSTSALALYERGNLGVTGAIRYPKDPYDRNWPVLSKPEWSSLSTASMVSTIIPYEPPSDVMKTAAYPTTGSSLKHSWPWITNPIPWFYIFVHFSELQQLKANEKRIFNVAVNDQTYLNPITPQYLKTTSEAIAIDPRLVTQNAIALSIVQAIGSTMPPILNAVEIYSVVKTEQSETDAGDVNAITTIKELYKLQKNWMGDPCLPNSFIWDGLNCSYDGTKSPRIISLNLSSSGLTGQIPTSLANMTQLQSLDLSRNDMQGGIPDFLASLTRLTFLDLSGNKLNGPVPKGILDRSATGALTLRLGENSSSCLDSAVCGVNKKKTGTLVIAVVISLASTLILLAGALIILRHRRQKRKNPGSPRNLQSKGETMHNNGYFHMPLDNKQFTYNDLVTITSNFKKEIGRGGFGPVYHGVMGDSVEVAIKVLDKKGSSQGPKEFQTEAQLLTRIHHRNLVSLVGYCKESQTLALVYEYMSNGSLEDHLRGKAGALKPLSWKERLRIALEAAQGLEYLHSGCNPSIIHRDIKPNNILLNQNMEAKIADFGISRPFQNDIHSHISTNIMGTPGYLDPECYITRKLTEKSDVYSFGIVLLELVTGKPVIFKEDDETCNIIHWVQPRFAGCKISEIIDKRLQGEYNDHSVWKVTEVAMECTLSTSAGRPTMNRVLKLLKECVQLEMTTTMSGNAIETQSMSDSVSFLIEMQRDTGSLLSPSTRQSSLHSGSLF